MMTAHQPQEKAYQKYAWVILFAGNFAGGEHSDRRRS